MRFRGKESSRRDRVRRLLNDAAKIRLRRREKVRSVEVKRERILSAVGPALAWLRKQNTHAKGAYDVRTFGFRRQIVEEMLALPFFADAVRDPASGELPAVTYVERVLREAEWFVEARNEPEDYIQRTLGWRPRFAGDVILADWTGLPIKVKGAVLETVNKQSGKKERKYKKFGMHLAVDAATNHTWLDTTYGDNELAGWPSFLRWLLFEGLGYAPNFLVMDQVSGVVTSLRSADPDAKHITVMPEVLGWVAAGVRLIVHTPERPNAKGHVESAARLIKHRELQALTVRRCLQRHLQGDLGKPREFASHAEAARLIAMLPEAANKRILTRDGVKIGARSELWMAQEDQAHRAARAFAPEAATAWREVVSRAKAVWCEGRTLMLRHGGIRHVAELTGLDEAGLGKIERAVAWIVPPLPAAHLDPEEYRVCLIDTPEQGGLPRFYSLGAKVAKKDRFGFDEARPFLGEGYRALPDTAKDEVAKVRDLAAGTWERQVRALREGTTDSPATTDSPLKSESGR